MQSSQWGRLCLLILLSVSLTACDQMVAQLDQFMTSGKEYNCASGKSCDLDVTDDQQLNWFLKEVNKH